MFSWHKASDSRKQDTVQAWSILISGDPEAVRAQPLLGRLLVSADGNKSWRSHMAGCVPEKGMRLEHGALKNKRAE